MTHTLTIFFAGTLLLSAQGKKPDELDIPRASIPGLQPSRTWGQPFERLTNREKFHYQLYATFGPWGSGTAVASAVIDQWQDDPFEWGQGWDAFGKRLASRMGTRIVRRSIRHTLSVVRHEDPRFFRSGEHGFWPRLKNQLKQTVVTRTDSGGVTFASGRVVGAFAAAQVAQVWMPDSRDGFGVNLRRGGMVLVGDFGARVFREFWPDIQKRVFRKK